MKKSVRSLLALLLSLILCLSLFPCALAEDIHIVDAEEEDLITIVENDDPPVGRTFQTAKPIEFGQEYMAYWTKDTDHLFFYLKFTVPERGKIDFYFTKPLDSEGEYGRLELELYDESGESAIWGANCYKMDSTASDRYKFTVGLNEGTYYLTVKPRFTVQSGFIESYYCLNFTATQFYEVEPNAAASTATVLQHGVLYGANIGQEDESDYFRFPAEEGKIYRLYFGNWGVVEPTTILVTLYTPSGTSHSIEPKSLDDRGDYLLFQAISTGYYTMRYWNYGGIPVNYTVGIFEDGKEYLTPFSTSFSFSCSTNGVAVSWQGASGATDYELQRKDSGDWSTVGTTASTSYTDASAKMGVTYKYRVRAYMNGAWSDWSDAASILFNPFKDVSGNKTIEYVSWAYNNDIVKGTSTTTFAPDNPCTRIQFVMMLWKMHGSPEVSGTNPFSDVSGAKTVKAILWALKAGVINSGDSFNPNGNITRVQIVMILWKLAGSPEVSGANPFTDVSGAKTTKAVLWAYQNGITKGTSDTTFAPNKDCTRVQLVVFLYKYNGIYQVI